MTRADIDALLSVANDPAALATVLRTGLAEKTARGTSKARALLERLMDHIPEELDASHVEPVMSALIYVGDELLVPTDKIRGEFDFGNESRVRRVMYHLLKKVDLADRCRIVSLAIGRGQALRCGQFLIRVLVEEVEKEAGVALIRAEDVDGLKSAWMSRVADLSGEPTFIDHPSLAHILSGWRHWGGEVQAKAWWAQVSSNDEGLIKLIAAFQSESTSHGFGDHAVQVHLRVNPKGIEPYGDVHALAARLQLLLGAGKVSESHLPAIRRFIVECELMKAGRNPDAFGFGDDD